LWTFPNNIRAENNNTLRCYWDHHTFKGTIIYCPISYRPRQVAKKGQNELKIKNNDVHINNFIIKENISKNKDISNLNVVEVTDAYYEVDGVFCSPECCLAYINEEKSKVGGSKYTDSERLLHFMLGLTTRISPANNFRLLLEYGGNLTIEQFRKKNKSIKYVYYGTTVPISHLFEKKINLSTD
jgi:hypothetical protein